MTPNNEAKVTEHTPTPWIVDGQDIMSGEHEIALMTDTNFDWKANAAFIVRAVNAHDDLLERLLIMATAFHIRADHRGDFRFCDVEVCLGNRRAIALAEGRPGGTTE